MHRSESDVQRVKISRVAKRMKDPPEPAPSQICDNLITWSLFDAADRNGQSYIAVLIGEKRLGKREIAQLNQKLDMLEKNGPSLPPQLLAGPVKSARKPKMVSHIYKLRLNGDRALRPFLCKSPIDMDREFTMLLGAIEINSVLDTDAEDAENVRSAVIADQKLRGPHERYK